MVVLREGLRVLLTGRDDRRSESDPAASRDLVAGADLMLESVALRLSLDGETGAPTLRPAAHSRGDSELATVAVAVARAQLDGSLSRVKVCARATCRWAYFDASRNRSKQWCSMAGCGNVEKNRAYRARRSRP